MYEIKRKIQVNQFINLFDYQKAPRASSNVINKIKSHVTTIIIKRIQKKSAMLII